MRESLNPRRGRPTWKLLLLTLVVTPFLAWCGMTLYFFWTHCFDLTRDCAAYSPARMFIAKAVLLPIFILHKIYFGPTDNIVNFDPDFAKGGWIYLFVYYYLWISTGSIAIRRFRHRAKSKKITL